MIFYVLRVDESTPEGKDQASLTELEEAVRYVNVTDVDIVALTIGNVHGCFTGFPKLNFDLLQNLHEKVDIPLALHGGSGC